MTTCLRTAWERRLRAYLRLRRRAARGRGLRALLACARLRVRACSCIWSCPEEGCAQARAHRAELR
eukprot:186977-Pleurochrysis_carterae.AAC.1